MERVYFYYARNQILRNITLSLDEGEFLVLVGPNGSGKSTLLNIILGFLKPHCGLVKVLGFSSKEVNGSGLSYVSQMANRGARSFPATVREVVSSGLYSKVGLFRRFSKTSRLKVDELLEELGILSLASSNIGELSGGQQQRVYIARALISNPKLLILDEPTVGIDTESTERFYELLRYLNSEKDLSIILVTHDIELAPSYANRVVYLNKEIVFNGSPMDFDYREVLVNSCCNPHHDHYSISKREKFPDDRTV